MTNLTTDEKTYRSSYAAGEYNAIMEIEALETGLRIDESVTIPWDWIRAALSSIDVERPSVPPFDRSGT
jgi:hypothetical protein